MFKGNIKVPKFTKNNMVTQGKYDEIMNEALGSQTLSVINSLETNNINPTNINLVDKSKQNLLHLACKTKNYMLAEYLINKNVSHKVKNLFNETALDIAIKNGDVQMIGLLYGTSNIDNYKLSILKLEDKCNDFKLNIEMVMGINCKLEREKMEACEQLNNVTRTNKRLRDNHDTQEREIKKLKTENSLLTNDNKTLQITVNNLRSTMKK